ncbi:hypothetical protein [Lactococcus kimchii]|uniref:hypothetical protein n=1 Tax=Lactococcus sp. S-13 TaxID=2507158 RepID=UPI00102326B3|nr:hypothetical protein [Lactococcus sp. S-13]RZI48395.1 hypothetical protein EQJ87_02405 [Lactococcus sp. S-13]
MITWFKLTPTYSFGFFPIGLLFLFLQKIPYLLLPPLGVSIAPLIKLPEHLSWFDGLEKILGLLTLLTFLFIVRDDLQPRHLFLRAAVVPLSIYYVGWGVYCLGYQNLLIYLFFLIATPPLYYFCLGLWLKNRPATFCALVYLLVHFINFGLHF